MLLDSFKRLKPALVPTLQSDNVDAPVEFTKKDWDLISQVLSVLKPFQDATKMLSYHDASISLGIPIITSIMRSLNVTDADHGVKTMKRALMENLAKRFSGMEEDYDYAVSTMLDCKFKKYFYRNPDTLERTREFIIEKLVADLREEENVQVCVSFNAYLASNKQTRQAISKNNREVLLHFHRIWKYHICCLRDVILKI